MNLKKILDQININADWIGLRQVKETATYRAIRDNNPVSNHKDQSQGIMIEVLKNGQFGYCATNRFDIQSIQFAAQEALTQAESASSYSLSKFSQDARPQSIGQYSSQYVKSADSVSAGELNELLIKANTTRLILFK